ncbi:MAG: class I SAM-dependent methyltransferase [Chloroflexota bacterium]
MNSYDTIARFYDLEHDTLIADRLMYEGFARQCGSPVLELGCGTGRLALHLARAGFQVTGVDHSPAMLAIARHKLARSGLAAQVQLLQADLAHLALNRRYPLATLAINTFMHFVTLADQLHILEVARRHLQPDGLLIIDLPRGERLMSPEAGGPYTVTQVLTDAGSGRPVFKTATVTPHPADQMQLLTLAYDETDDAGLVHRCTASFEVRYFYRYELELLLDKAGLEVTALYGSYALDAYEDDSERMILVARPLGT